MAEPPVKDLMAALKASLGVPERRECLCMECGREYPVWYAPNNLWNRVMRAPDGREASERVPFICPTCFGMKAQATGVTARWSFAPDTDDLDEPFDQPAQHSRVEADAVDRSVAGRSLEPPA